MSAKSYTLAPVAGGQTPDVGKLLSVSMAEFGDNLAPYAILAAIQMAIAIPLVFFAIFAGYLGSGILGTLVYLVGMAISLGIGGLLGDDLGGVIGGLGMVITFFASMITYIGCFFVVLVVAMLPLAPVHAAALRAIVGFQRGGPAPEPASLFATIGQDLVQVLLVAVLASFANVVGLMFFGFGVFVPMFLFAFAAPLVAVHRMSAIEALRASAKHAMAYASWHAMYTLLFWAISVAASNIPVIGPAFMLAFQARAYREVFGDGETPVV